MGNRVFIVSGPPGVGKSSVSSMIASSLPRSALINGDQVYHMVLGGHKPPWESEEQVSLCMKNISDLAVNFLNAGMDVVIDFVIFPVEAMAIASTVLNSCNAETHYAILVADLSTIRRRDESRKEKMGSRVEEVLREFAQEKLMDRYSIDTSSMSPEKISRLILTEDRYVMHGE